MVQQKPGAHKTLISLLGGHSTIHDAFQTVQHIEQIKEEEDVTAAQRFEEHSFGQPGVHGPSLSASVLTAGVQVVGTRFAGDQTSACGDVVEQALALDEAETTLTLVGHIGERMVAIVLSDEASAAQVQLRLVQIVGRLLRKQRKSLSFRCEKWTATGPVSAPLVFIRGVLEEDEHDELDMALEQCDFLHMSSSD
ncbi:hypothetical protein BpHYR1_032230 [Brachionus plicatilis]|uniref:Uncharacterized protein n=1 Tax=Brachionus plicatilis TaxID=10195 RepID=A0A3M7T9N6_BRAPC|nr:hypothetical protein BpHYR1_032230 [Brachionus plicatilis]